MLKLRKIVAVMAFSYNFCRIKTGLPRKFYKFDCIHYTAKWKNVERMKQTVKTNELSSKTILVSNCFTLAPTA